MFSVAASTKSRVSLAMSSSDGFPAWPSRRGRAGPYRGEDVRGVRVGVEEAVPEDHRHPRVRHPRDDVVPLVGTHRGEVGDLRSVEVLEGEDAAGRVAADDPWDDDPVVAGEVAVEGLGVPRLVPVVELEPDRARELVHELVRVHELERFTLLEKARGLVQEPEVGLDLGRRRRTRT